MFSNPVLGFVVLSVLSTCNGYVAYDELYANGLEAYWSEDWPGCINYFEQALESYRFSKEGVAQCSKECKKSIVHSPVSTSMKFILDKAICMESCERRLFGDSQAFSRISEDTKNVFHSKLIYKYLQFAYFRNGDFGKSLEVTYTYILYDPEDPMMKKNMEFYNSHKNTTNEMYINRDAKLHQVYFDNGISAYNKEEYDKAISLFEKALVEFYKAEEDCLANCEGEYDVGLSYPDTQPSFFQQIIDHYRAVLECSMSCHIELARTSKTKVSNNYLPKHYSYLQFAYKQVNKLKESLECAQTYLMFHPQNKVMEEFVFFPRTGSVIASREKAVDLHKRIQIQAELLKYIYQNFGIYDYDPLLLTPYAQEDVDDVHERADSQQKAPTNNVQDAKSDTSSEKGSGPEGGAYLTSKEKTNDIINSKDQYNGRMDKLRKKRDAETSNKEQDVDIGHLHQTPIGRHTVDSSAMVTINDAYQLPMPVAEGPLLFDHVTLLANSTQMLGPMRFAVDGFATESQCQELIDLELAGGLAGDGYRGLTSPHTEHESFEGLSVLRAVELAEQGLFPLRSAQLYYDLSEQVRAQVKAYFKLEEELYFDYTHLVCRLATGGELERKDLSHPVHGDNCILEENGNCVKRDPAYTWRDYSSIMYLNDEFDGGEFIMTDETARRVKLQVKPRCGRLVSFCAGKECLHGVKPITRGRRCAMALWFTQDPSHDEERRMVAKKKLDQLQKDEL